MNLLESLLDAVVRLEGDALVLHVGEKPYVVTTSLPMHRRRGPLAWGQVELSSRVLTPDAVLGMLGQILPVEQRQALDEAGSIDFDIPPSARSMDHFTVIAARGGDDIWLEIRRNRPKPIVQAAPAQAAPAPAAVEPAATAPEPETIAASDPVEIAAAEEPIPAEPPTDAVMTETPVLASERTRDAEEPVIAATPATELVFADVPVITARPAIEPVIAEEPVSDGAAMLVSAEPAIDASVPSPEAVDRPNEEPLVYEWSHPVSTMTPEPVERASEEPEPVPDAAVASSDIDAQPMTYAVEIPIEADDPAIAAPPPPIALAADVITAAPAPAPVDDVVAATSEPEVPYVAPSDAHSAILGRSPIASTEEPTAVADEPPLSASAPPPERFRVPAPSAVFTPEPEFAAVPTPPMSEPRAVVVPIGRRSAPPAPQQSSAVSVLGIEELLRTAAARGASTVYVVAKSDPMIRADGEISALDFGAPLSESDIDRMLLEVAPPSARDAWQRGAAAEWTFDVADIGRVRALTFADHRGHGLIFRMLPPLAISADQLGLSAEVQRFCDESDGLVLVGGPRSSGKSTLLTAFVDLINRTRSDYVITLESQIGFVHENRRSFISQRVAAGENAAPGLKGALREDPDVVVIEDLRSAEVASMALEAADTGRLVFASIAAASSVAAVERFLELFPAERREQAQATMAGVLRGVVSQVLLRRARGGRIAVREVLLTNSTAAGLIEQGQTAQLARVIESGRRIGMAPLNDALAAVVRNGTVHVTEAYRKALDKDALLAALKRDSVDTSVVERLA